MDAVKVDDQNAQNGEGCIGPSDQTVSEGTYQPLSRPLFIYVKQSAAENKPQVRKFVQFYMDSANRNLISEIGYVPLTDSLYQQALKRFEDSKTGTVFEGGSTAGVKLNEVL
jgi:phosphate transport system substrate-binding protein